MIRLLATILGLGLLLSTATACTEPEPVTVTREIVGTRIVTVEPLATCTQIGCADSLRITLSGSVPADFVLEATADGVQAHVVHCRNGEVVMSGDSEANIAAPATCGTDWVMLPQFAPAEVTISLRWDTEREIMETFQPEYTDFRPNGPDCEPVCRTGEIRLEVE